jgi:hypothetical protein
VHDVENDQVKAPIDVGRWASDTAVFVRRCAGCRPMVAGKIYEREQGHVLRPPVLEHDEVISFEATNELTRLGSDDDVYLDKGDA